MVRFSDGQEGRVSASDLAPFPRHAENTEELSSDIDLNPTPQNHVNDSTLDFCVGFRPETEGPLSSPARPSSRHHLTINNCYADLQEHEHEHPLIILVTGPAKFKGGNVPSQLPVTIARYCRRRIVLYMFVLCCRNGCQIDFGLRPCCCLPSNSCFSCFILY